VFSFLVLPECILTQSLQRAREINSFRGDRVRLPECSISEITERISMRFDISKAAERVYFDKYLSKVITSSLQMTHYTKYWHCLCSNVFDFNEK
jgi:hypothetical protein